MPSELSGTTEWMRWETDKIEELYRNNSKYFRIDSVCRDLPGSEWPKEYYIDKIRELFTSAQDGGI